MSDCLSLVVVGAHLRGQPLSHELVDLGGTFARAARTAPLYRLYALAGPIEKPGLVRVAELGRAFEVEVWSVPRVAIGDFLTRVKAPLCLGTVALEEGSESLGFLCESYATAHARDISEYPGWVAYRERGAQSA